MESDGNSAKSLDALNCTVEDIKIEREIYTTADSEKYMELSGKDRGELSGMEFILLQRYYPKPSAIWLRFRGKDWS